jgi:hypothetical protein
LQAYNITLEITKVGQVSEYYINTFSKKIVYNKKRPLENNKKHGYEPICSHPFIQNDVLLL